MQRIHVDVRTVPNRDPQPAVLRDPYRVDMSHLVGSFVFALLSDIDWYLERCTVLKGTPARDRSVQVYVQVSRQS